MSPGSYSANATEIYQEGLRIPPVKLFKQGVRNEEIWAMIGQNVRQPAIVLGDLQSQIASLGVGASSVTSSPKNIRRRCYSRLPSVARHVGSRHA